MHRLLIALHALLGVAAVAAGSMLTREPSGEQLRFETEWLDGSPFGDYRVPGLFLAFVIGGTNLISGASLWRRRPWARLVSLATGVLLLVWIAIQTRIIGLRDWMQLAWAAVFFIVTLLAFREVRQAAALGSGRRGQRRLS